MVESQVPDTNQVKQAVNPWREFDYIWVSDRSKISDYLRLDNNLAAFIFPPTGVQFWILFKVVSAPQRGHRKGDNQKVEDDDNVFHVW